MKVCKPCGYANCWCPRILNTSSFELLYEKTTEYICWWGSAIAEWCLIWLEHCTVNYQEEEAWVTRAYRCSAPPCLHPVSSPVPILFLLDWFEHEGGVGRFGEGGQPPVFVEVGVTGSAQQDVIPPAMVPVLGCWTMGLHRDYTQTPRSASDLMPKENR